MTGPSTPKPAIGRRGLLAASAALGAAAALSRRVLGRAPSHQLDAVNVALVGVGAQGRRLLESLVKMDGLRFKAVCDISPFGRKLGAGRMGAYKHDAKPFVDFHEMLAQTPDLDAVVIATPDWVHAEQSVAAMTAGLHVYCEKEMSNTLAGAREMVLAARKTGRLLQIGHQRRSNPRYFKALEYIHTHQAVGRITHMQGQWNRYRALQQAAGKKKSAQVDPAALKRYGYDTMERLLNWRWYRKFSGGPIADLGSHQVDIFNWVLGAAPRSIVAVGGRDYYESTEWYDNASVFYEWQYQWQGKARLARAVYQVLNTTSHGAYFEAFLGDEGSLVISENTQVRSGIRREMRAPKAPWEASAEMLAALKAAGKPAPKVTETGGAAVVKPPSGGGRVFPIPTAKELEAMPVHRWHLENFFAAVREPKKVKLNCPGEVGYETAASVLPVNDAIQKRGEIKLAPDQFTV